MRLDHDDGALGPRRRSQALGFIRAYPGLHLSEIARRLQWSSSLAEYHLRILERTGLVSSTQVGQSRCYFPNGLASASSLGGVKAVAPTQKAALSLLRHPVRLHIALLLAAEPQCPQGRVAATVGLSRPATSHHLGRLLRGGVVARNGGGYILADPAAVLSLLRSHRPPMDHVQSFQSLWDDLFP